MNQTLLESILARLPRGPGPAAHAPGQAAHATGPAPTAATDDGTGSKRGTSALHSGRFERWHVDTVPVQEEEAWLIAYLDVMTLLLAMLVVMLAFTDPVSEVFRGEQRGAGLDQLRPPVQAAADAGTTILPPVPLPHPATAPARVEGDPVDVRAAPVPPEPPALNLGDLGQNVEVVTEAKGVTRFRISSELLFAPGQAALTPAGQRVIDELLPVLNQAMGHTIVVEGHTDNVPIATARFPSNWELAAGRAGAVVRHLETRGVNPMRLRATGVADTKPLADNATAQGRAQNRRVEIVLEAPPVQ